ncbi:MAG TPA: hypothetical protein PKD09_04385 [Aggregatilinea sp.]|uniref:hypothetical protein n=1 Tax=Aggregatilinea sp. TaxID=2806333 RepID=UPI002C923C60|nr:hypothetical protein [Aggregatilinea sp.]HML20861.1 hypothetical protein [Aggregatilinea sp.]
MDILETLLGRDRPRDSGLFDRLGNLSRWIIGCGCLLVVAIVAGVALLVAGVVQLGDQAIPLLIVIGVIVAAVFSLVRLQL